MADKILTFAEARGRAVHRINTAMIGLREVVSDPQFCNDMSPVYKNAKAEFEYALSALIRLNNVESEVNR